MIRKLEGLEQLCPHFFFPPKYSKHNITTNSTRFQPKSARNFPHQRCFFIVTCNWRLLCPQTASELTKLNFNFSNRQKKYFFAFFTESKAPNTTVDLGTIKNFSIFLSFNHCNFPIPFLCARSWNFFFSLVDQ